MITIKLDLSEADVLTICTAINLGDEKLGEQLFRKLKQDDNLLYRFIKQLNDTDLVAELVDGSYEGCANGWLEDFSLV